MNKKQLIQRLDDMKKDLAKAVDNSAEEEGLKSRRTLVNAITDIQLRIIEIKRDLTTY